MRTVTIPTDVIRRPRLERRLDGCLERRLGLLIADAGFGKSTLLATWGKRRRLAWCTLTERENTLSWLTRQLLRALEAAQLDLSSGIPGGLERLTARTSDTEPTQSRGVASLLCELLETRLDEHLVLVFDDAHELVPGSPGARLLAGLTAEAPPLVHVVIASRVAAPFPIQRLRGRGDVVELTSAELAFTLDEVSFLVDDTLGPRDDELADRLHAATGGWPAAVRLAVEAARGGADAAAILERLVQPTGPLHAYLAEEVLAQEVPPVREVLRRAALLDPVSAELCEALGAAGAAEALHDLVRRGFAVELGRGWFSVHALVREYARSAWPLHADEHDLRRAAAAWFESEGLLERALSSHRAAGDTSAIAALLDRHARSVLDHVGAETYVRYAALVPDGGLSPDVEAVLGEAHMTRGDTEQAVAHLKRASSGGSRPSPAVAWRLVAAHYLRDDLAEALDVYRRCRRGAASPADEALLHGWAASVERRRGNHGAARSLATKALRIAERSGDDRALALAHTACGLGPQGREPDGERHLRHALAAAERAGDLFQSARIRNNRASQLLEEGAYLDAIHELDIAMLLAEVGGFTSLLALATMNRGLCRWCLGRLDEAAVDYGSALAHYRLTGSAEEAYALIGLGDVHRERGDIAQARTRYEQGLALAETTGDRQALVPAQYQLAKVLVDDEPQRAEKLARSAVEHGWPDFPWALNAQGWIALVHGDRDAAAHAAERAATAARELRDPFGLAESHELAAFVAQDPAPRSHALAEALALWRSVGNVVHEAAVELALAELEPHAHEGRSARRAARRLRNLGVRVTRAAPAGILRFVASGRSPTLSIETLGGFRVMRVGKPVPASEWRSHKARDTLKILAARRGAPAPRDVLMEALWPGAAPEKAANRLSVALSTLRSVLDPAREHQPDRYLRVDGDAVALALPNLVLDIVEFDAEAREGLELRGAGRAAEARERLEHAVLLYRGDFLEEDAYEDWAIPLREEMRALHADVARALGEDSLADGRPDKAARYSLRILDRDRYDERAHLTLVTALVAGGRHGEARRAYGGYCRRMEEIGVEPAPFPAAV